MPSRSTNPHPPPAEDPAISFTLSDLPPGSALTKIKYIPPTISDEGRTVKGGKRPAGAPDTYELDHIRQFLIERQEWFDKGRGKRWCPPKVFVVMIPKHVSVWDLRAGDYVTLQGRAVVSGRVYKTEDNHNLELDTLLIEFVPTVPPPGPGRYNIPAGERGVISFQPTLDGVYISDRMAVASVDKKKDPAPPHAYWVDFQCKIPAEVFARANAKMFTFAVIAQFGKCNGKEAKAVSSERVDVTVEHLLTGVDMPMGPSRSRR